MCSEAIFANEGMVEGSGIESNFLTRLNEAAKLFNDTMRYAGENMRLYKISHAKKRLKAA